MSSANPVSGFRLTVLNPGGRDPEQQFSDGAGEVGAQHAPVNFHAFAACTGGSFHRETKKAIAENTPVLLLLRGDLKAAQRALEELKARNRFVAISFKETGMHQIAEQLGHHARVSRFSQLVEKADACLCATPEAAELFRSVKSGPNKVAYIPTPYPVADERWDFGRRASDRSGIFVGTREWGVPTRNHLAALLVARGIAMETGEPISVFNSDGRSGASLLQSVGIPAHLLRVLDRKLRYPDYLRELAKHKIVWQLDASFVPGQVAGDALLCRMPCLGGNGAVEREAFADTCGYGHAIDELQKLANRLLQDRAFYEQTVARSQERAKERLSFKAMALRLREFFGGSRA